MFGFQYEGQRQMEGDKFPFNLSGAVPVVCIWSPRLRLQTSPWACLPGEVGSILSLALTFSALCVACLCPQGRQPDPSFVSKLRARLFLTDCMVHSSPSIHLHLCLIPFLVNYNDLTCQTGPSCSHHEHYIVENFVFFGLLVERYGCGYFFFF